MRDFAIVKSIDGQKIEVVSLISDACVACNSKNCAKQGKSFHVLNKKNLPLEEDCIIRIGFPRVLNGILGLISLVFPVFSAAEGFFLAPFLASRFGFELNQMNLALVTASFFIFAAFLVFVVSRTDLHLSHPEVIQIV